MNTRAKENGGTSDNLNSLVSNPKMSCREITVSCPHCDYDYLVEPEETQVECNNPECRKTFRFKVE